MRESLGDTYSRETIRDSTIEETESTVVQGLEYENRLVTFDIKPKDDISM